MERRASLRTTVCALFLGLSAMVCHFMLTTKVRFGESSDRMLSLGTQMTPFSLASISVSLGFNLARRVWSYLCVLSVILAVALFLTADAIHTASLPLQAYSLYLVFLLATVTLMINWHFQANSWHKKRWEQLFLRNVVASALGWTSMSTSLCFGATLGRLLTFMQVELPRLSIISSCLFGGCMLGGLTTWAWLDASRDRLWPFIGFFPPFVLLTAKAAITW